MIETNFIYIVMVQDRCKLREASKPEALDFYTQAETNEPGALIYVLEYKVITNSENPLAIQRYINLIASNDCTQNVLLLNQHFGQPIPYKGEIRHA